MGRVWTSQTVITQVPWWTIGSAVDLDFLNNRYWDGASGGAAITSLLTITRASTGTAKNSSGTWISFANNVLRITDLGLLTEDTRTNNLLNSDVPATQTTASLGTGSYTLWVEGTGSALASAGTATITGAAPATDGSPDTFSVTVAGTVIVTVTGSLDRFQLEAGAFPTSYIPTTGATATRAADAILTSGALSAVWGGATALTAFADLLTTGPTGFINMSFLGDNSAGARILFANFDNQVACNNNSSDLARTMGGGVLYQTGAKVAYSQDGSHRSVAGGGASTTDAAPFLTFNAPIKVGGVAGGSGHAYARFRRLTAWSTSLSDATIQGLTAP